MESVVRQTFTDMEVILVDDGSPDRCPQMCDEWARRDSRVRVIHQANGGLSRARNAGIEAARGTLITFVDSDDFIDRDTYAQTVPLMEDADITEYPLYWHYGANDQEIRHFGEEHFIDMKDYWLRGRAYEHTYACNKIFRRQLFDEVHFPTDRVFEDVATLPLLLQKARKVVTTQRGCYYYCMNAYGITSTSTGHELRMLLESHIEAMQRWLDDGYYMHVLNTQMDVCERLGVEPTLPMRHVNIFHHGLNARQRIKAVLLNLIGVKGICQVNKFTHKTLRYRS
jgi:glycosyltransferase involved in cell wall biosynthesis